MGRQNITEENAVHDKIISDKIRLINFNFIS